MTTSLTVTDQSGNSGELDAKKTAVEMTIRSGAGAIRLTRLRDSATFPIQQNN